MLKRESALSIAHSLAHTIHAAGFLIGSYLFGQSAVHLGRNLQAIPQFFLDENTSKRAGEHEYERDVRDIWSDSYLQFDQGSSLPKTLWLSAAYDYNNASNPILYYGWRGWDDFEKASDLKYKVIEHPKQICEEMRSAMGPVRNLVLTAHGNSKAIVFGKKGRLSILHPLPKGCFENMESEGKIFLDSCSTGAHLYLLNIAEWLSKISNRTVFASSDLTSWVNQSLSLSETGDLDLDFCQTEAVITDGERRCENSIRRAFSPPKSWMDQILFTLKVKLQTLTGLLTACQLSRLSLDGLQSASRLVLYTLPQVEKTLKQPLESSLSLGVMTPLFRIFRRSILL